MKTENNKKKLNKKILYILKYKICCIRNFNLRKNKIFVYKFLKKVNKIRKDRNQQNKVLKYYK